MSGLEVWYLALGFNLGLLLGYAVHRHYARKQCKFIDDVRRDLIEIEERKNRIEAKQDHIEAKQDQLDESIARMKAENLKLRIELSIMKGETKV